MSAAGLPATPPGKVIRHDLQAIRGDRIWLAVPGIGLVVPGIIMLGPRSSSPWQLSRCSGL